MEMIGKVLIGAGFVVFLISMWALMVMGASGRDD